MAKAPKRTRRAKLLAAPFVVTAALANGCGGPAEPPERPHVNPGPPTTDPTAQPSATSGLPDAPNDGSGRVEKRADGTCVYVYPPPDTSCPPDVQCNPGPPREPMPVKCPAK